MEKTLLDLAIDGLEAVQAELRLLLILERHVRENDPHKIQLALAELDKLRKARTP